MPAYPRPPRKRSIFRAAGKLEFFHFTARRESDIFQIAGAPKLPSGSPARQGGLLRCPPPLTPGRSLGRRAPQRRPPLTLGLDRWRGA